MAPIPARVVVVDDEPAILELLVEVLQPVGEVRAFSTGRSALAHMEAEGVDVLLTDKNLPDLGGLELLGHAQRIQPDAEVILITGYASLDTALEAMAGGAFDYIVKPPKSIFDVRRKVEQALHKQRITRENVRLVDDLRRKNRDLEEALDEVRRVQAELVQSEKLAGIGTLAAGIAHEVSSPLMGVLGLAEAILDEEDPEVVRGHAAEIVTHARSIQEIVVHLSGYARDARREYETAAVLGHAVGDAVRLVERSLGLPAGAVRVDVPAELRVSAKAGELQQIFVNLVKNGVEATREHHGSAEGHVWVEARALDDHVEIRVGDDGPGIPEAHQRSIFDPFFTTKPPGKGTGLGLNIVWRLVTRYRGTITAEDAAAGGTVFVLRFPRPGEAGGADDEASDAS